MSTKTMKNPKAIARLRGKTLKPVPFVKQARYKIPIRNNLKSKKTIKSNQKPLREVRSSQANSVA